MNTKKTSFLIHSTLAVFLLAVILAVPVDDASLDQGKIILQDEQISTSKVSKVDVISPIHGVGGGYTYPAPAYVYPAPYSSPPGYGYPYPAPPPYGYPYPAPLPSCIGLGGDCSLIGCCAPNQCIAARCEPPDPDLGNISLAFEHANGDPVTAMDPAYFTEEITAVFQFNDEEALDPFFFDIFFWDDRAAEPDSCVPPDAGETLGSTFSLTEVTAGVAIKTVSGTFEAADCLTSPCTITAWSSLDAGCGITETDEGNNIVSGTYISVESVTISAPTTSPDPAFIGDTVTFTVPVIDLAVDRGVRSCVLFINGVPQGGMSFSSFPCLDCDASLSLIFPLGSSFVGDPFATHDVFARCANGFTTAIDSPTAMFDIRCLFAGNSCAIAADCCSPAVCSFFECSGLAPPPPDPPFPPPGPDIGGGSTFLRNPLTVTSLPDFIDVIANWLLSIALVLAPILIVIAGIILMTASGDPNRVSTGKRMLLWTVVGFLIILLSRALVTIIRSVVG